MLNVEGKFKKTKILLIDVIRIEPIIAPNVDPCPPSNAIPPITHAAIAVISYPVPSVGVTNPIRLA